MAKSILILFLLFVGMYSQAADLWKLDMLPGNQRTLWKNEKGETVFSRIPTPEYHQNNNRIDTFGLDGTLLYSSKVPFASDFSKVVEEASGPEIIGWTCNGSAYVFDVVSQKTLGEVAGKNQKCFGSAENFLGIVSIGPKKYVLIPSVVNGGIARGTTIDILDFPSLKNIQTVKLTDSQLSSGFLLSQAQGFVKDGIEFIF